MTRTVAPRRARVEAELRGEVAAELEVAAAKAWRRMSDRIGPVIAHELGLGKELVEAYGNAFKQKRGPHLRLLQALRIAAALKPLLHQRAEVFAPLDFVEAQLGRRVIDIAALQVDQGAASRAELIALALIEVAQFAHAAAPDPASWTPEQQLHVHQQLQEALGALSALAQEMAPPDRSGGSGVPSQGPHPMPPRIVR